MMRLQRAEEFAKQGWRKQMARALALSFVFATLTMAVAHGAGTIDTAAMTCKDYEMSGHTDMVAMNDAVHETLKNDPKLGALDRSGLNAAIYSACAKDLGAKVIDALKVGN
jgi:hypothetical protein